MPVILHPKLDEQGKTVAILMPTAPTPLASWENGAAVATVVPGGELPAGLGGVAFAPVAAGAAAGASGAFEEPPMPTGKPPAAGVVIVESDGRVWLVSPTNRFGGYGVTFPKGKTDGSGLRETAIREAWEESGLVVELLAFIVDSPRTTSITRYYLARRLEGSPADMGWETQAVHLVPPDRLVGFVDHPNDKALAATVLKHLAAG